MDSDTKFVAVLLVLVACLVGSCVYSCSDGTFPGYSEGTRSGKIIKVSRKGLIWKSWDATMLMEGMAEKSTDKGTTFTPNLCEFSTADRAIAEALNSAMQSGKPVTIEYSQYFTSPFWLGSDYEVRTVKKGE